MTEDVSRETGVRLEHLTALILDENKRQNLISASSADQFQMRHLHDSLQLLELLKPGTLIDIGSGAGLPGLAIACASTERMIHLVEPRTKRAAFLQRAVQELQLGNVTVHARRVEQMDVPEISNITARAVARLDGLFAMALHLSKTHTRWVLPKGRTASDELAEAQRIWQGEFSMVPSSTDASAAIVIAEKVRRRRE